MIHALFYQSASSVRCGAGLVNGPGSNLEWKLLDKLQWVVLICRERVKYYNADVALTSDTTAVALQTYSGLRTKNRKIDRYNQSRSIPIQ